MIALIVQNVAHKVTDAAQNHAYDMIHKWTYIILFML